MANNEEKTKKPIYKKWWFWIILIIIIVIIMASNSSTNTSNTSSDTSGNNLINSVKEITLDEFNKIETGMTYQQVKDIIGSEGTLSSDVNIGDEESHTQIYTWYGNKLTGANANVTFQGGKVIAKAQVGLK